MNDVPESDTAMWTVLLDRLSATEFQIALVVSGGGSGAIAKCFRRPGASRTFVEAVVAYSRRAMMDYLRRDPVGASASIETARQLSQVAQGRCQRLTDAENSQAVGIALVAALPTSVTRRGTDRIHVALAVGDEVRTWSRELTQGEFTRASAEDLADEMFLAALKDLLKL